MEVACDVLSVQLVLGHTDLRITMICTHVPNRVLARGEKTGRCLVRNKAAMRAMRKRFKMPDWGEMRVKPLGIKGLRENLSRVFPGSKNPSWVCPETI
jgi:hypothetical protein